MKMEESFEWVENTGGKAEIAHYMQFLHFPLCFLNTCPADSSNPELVWERVKVGFFENGISPKSRVSPNLSVYTLYSVV